MATDKRHVAIKNSEPQKGRSKKFDICLTEAEQDLIKHASALKKISAPAKILPNLKKKLSKPEPWDEA